MKSFKIAFSLGFMISILSDLYSQTTQKIDFTLSTVSYSHNYACGTDVNGVNPDPRFIIEYRMNSSQNFTNHIINQGNEIACGTTAYAGFNASMTGTCSNRIELKITSWEENGVLSNNEYNTPGDENLGAITSSPYYIDVTNYPNNSNITISLTNGNSVVLNLQWNFSALSPSTISSGGTVCRNKDAIMQLTPNQSDITNFKWYTDSLASGLGGNLIYLGNPATIPNALFNTASSYNLYVAGTIGNNCETKLQKVTINVNDIPAPLAVDANTPACYADKAKTKLHNFIAGDLVSGYYDISLLNKAGIDQTTDTFYTDPQTTSRNLYLVRKNTTTGCISNSVSTIMQVSPQLLPPVATDVTVCQEKPNILSASQAITPSNFIWYDVDNTTILKNALNSIGTDTILISQYTAMGTYRLHVQNSILNYTNSYRCFSAKTPIQLKIKALPAPPTAIPDTTCPGGTVDLSASAAVSGLYSWYRTATSAASLSNGQIYTTPAIFTNDMYYVTNTIDGCESHRTGVAGIVVPLLAPSVFHDTICQYEKASLSMPPVTNATGYAWHSTATGNNPVATGISFTTDTLPSSKIYYAEYQIGNCYSPRTATFAIVNPLPLPQNVRNNSPICTHDNLLLNVDNLLGCRYTWTGPNLYTSNLQNPSILNVDEANHQGAYTLIATDINSGCQSKPISTLADIRKKPDNIIATNNSPKCETETITLEATQMIQSSYSWSGPLGFSSTNRTPSIPNISKSQEGYYSVVVTADGCKSDTVKTYVQVFQNPKPVITPDTTIIQGQSVKLDVQHGIVYLWDRNPYLDAFNTRTPTATPPLGDHPFIVTIYDDKGCTGKDTVIVKVIAKTILEFTNFFTPNGDGQNDTWVINYIENIKDYDLKLFSLTGEVVFHSNDYKNDFNGISNNYVLPDGDYWYFLKHADKEYKGSITLRR